MAPANPTNASAILLESNNSAIQLLDTLSCTKDVGRAVTQHFVNNSVGLLFTWVIKAGVGLGVQVGNGFMITRLSTGKWSAPCYVKVAAGQAGFIVGVEKVETIMAATDNHLVQEVLEGHTPVLGSDLSLQVWPLLKGTTSEAMQALKDQWNTFDLLSISNGQGLIVDYSFKGGAISVHAARNEEVYGAGTTARDLLMGHVEAPKELVPLYDALEAISAGERGGVPT